MCRKGEQDDKPVKAVSAEKADIPRRIKPSNSNATHFNGKHKAGQPSSTNLKRALEDDEAELNDLGAKKLKLDRPQPDKAEMVDDRGAIVLDDDSDTGVAGETGKSGPIELD